MKFVIIKTTVGDREVYQRNLQKHLEYLDSLRQRGSLLSAGTFDDRSGGILLIEAEGMEEAIAVAREDPLILAGVERYLVRGWTPTLGEDAEEAPSSRTHAPPPVVASPLQVPEGEDEGFRVVQVRSDPRFAEVLHRCLFPARIAADDPSRRGYLFHAESRGLQKLVLLHEDSLVGQIEFAPAPDSGLPIEGPGLTVIHCLYVEEAYTGLEGGRRLLAACSDATDATSLAVVGFTSSLPWMPASFFEQQGFVTMDQVETGRFYGSTPVVAYLLWRPTRAGAEPPTWDSRRLLDGVDFCPGYPYLFDRRLYWGEQFEYHGVLAKEGLRRPEILRQLPPLASHQTDKWTMVLVGIPEADLNHAVELIQAALIDEPTYFAHVYGQGKVLIVFPDRVFSAGSEPESWKEAVQYGKDRGVPEEELAFPPFPG